MGEVHFEQKNFPQALENFQKALALGESRQMAGAVRWATSRIGDILRETGKPAEAVPYYQKAIEQIESTRSLLESEEYRQSYFEGGLRPYVSMMRALLAAGKRKRRSIIVSAPGREAFWTSWAEGAIVQGQERVAGGGKGVAGANCGNEGETFGRSGRRNRQVGFEKAACRGSGAYNTFLAKVGKQDKEQASL